MVQDYVREEEDGAALDIKKVIGSQECKVEMKGKVTKDILNHLLESPDTIITVNVPQTFSASLRKVMALTDEVLNAGDS